MAFFLIGCCFLIITSCTKDDAGEFSENTLTKNKTGNIGSVDYVFDDLDKIDQMKVTFSKMLARAISSRPELKRMLFDEFFAINSTAAEELFLIDLLTPRQGASARSESIVDIILNESGTSQEEINAFKDDLCNYPNLVLAVPTFIEMFKNSEYGDQYMASIATKPMVVMPSTNEANSEDNWVGYYDLIVNNKTQIYEIPSGGIYSNVTPLIVKGSELNLIFANENELLNGNNILESYFGSNFHPKVKKCLMDEINALKTQKVLCGQVYDVLDFDELDAIKHTCSFFMLFEENCNDGIDNDDDGYVDCEDQDCNCVEDCDDGIDNDGDGLVDGADPDCEEPTETLEQCCDGIDNDGDGFIDEEDSDCCYRDCRSDNNYLLMHAFDNVFKGVTTANAQVPGGETTTQIRMQITTMEKSCPTCPAEAETQHQIVTAKLYKLSCEITGFFSFLNWALQNNGMCQVDLELNNFNEFSVNQAFLGGIITNDDALVQEILSQGGVELAADGGLHVMLDRTLLVNEPILYLRNIRDWDASLIAEEIKFSLYEIDEVESSSTNSSTQTVTNTHTISASFGKKLVSGSNETTPSISYSFENETVNSVTTSYEITALHIYPLGDMSVFYCDEELPLSEYGAPDDFPNAFFDWNDIDETIHWIDNRNANMNFWDIIQSEE